MTQTDPLPAALKPLLKARGITCRMLGNELGLSEPSIKRMRAGRTMTVLQEFLLDGLGSADLQLRVEVRELSRASLALIRRKLDRLATEFDETAKLETSLPRKDRLSVGIALVCRPWTFSATAAMRRS